MREDRKNAALSHVVVSGMQGRITAFQVLNNAFRQVRILPVSQRTVKF